MLGLGELLTGVNLLEKIGKFVNWLRGRKNVPAETVAARFVRLFESHGVHRNQIPRFFGHGLELRDVQNDSMLVTKLNEEVLAAASTLFAVRREWLDGAEKQAHIQHDFYKKPKNFGKFLDELLAVKPNSRIDGMLLAPQEYLGHAEALLILQEYIGAVGEKAIYRFYLCSNWSFAYWKARACLTACVALAWKREVFISGVYAHKKEIELLSTGEVLLGWQGEGIWFFGHKKWYPEDMALKPDVFLEGVNPEQDNFGITSGLKLWLDLEKQGLMDTGMSTDWPGNAKLLFEQELTKQLSA